jgi:ornithine cyclodeaminase/alanine dehydrogenase-like protein (mu-crystallin family)
MNRSLPYFDADAIRRALPMREAVEVMKAAFAELSSGAAVTPLRSHVELPGRRRVLLMPCFSPAASALSVKTVTLCDDNPARGLPRIHALVTLFSGDTGEPTALFDGASLTALRTGAASGAATDLLARPDAGVVAILGTGAQARTQLEAMCAVRTIREARLFSPGRERAEAFARETTAATGLAVRVAATAAEAVRGADIVCAATSASTPVFDDCDLAPGTHINGVGSYQPTMQEVPAETVLRARVIVDHRESALSEAGDLLVPLRAGRWSADRIVAELGELVRGTHPGRTRADQITFFKSVGNAIQDLHAAARIAERKGGAAS